MTSKEEVQEDYEEFGVEEIIEQYMMNPHAGEIVVKHIKDLEVENKHLKDLLKSHGHKIKDELG